MSWRSALDPFFRELDERGVRYCVLHGWQRPHGRLDGDLDLAVAADDLEAAAEALERTGEVVQTMVSAARQVTFIVRVNGQAGGNGHGHRNGNGVGTGNGNGNGDANGQGGTAGDRHPSDRFLWIDLAEDVRPGAGGHPATLGRAGHVWFRDRALLRGRRRENGFWVSAPDVEFGYLLAKKIWKDGVPPDQARRLRELRAELGARADRIARDLLGNGAAAELSRTGAAGIDRRAPDWRRAMSRRALLRDPAGPFRYWPPELRRVWARVRTPTGLWVAVLGPDGAGKTSLLAGLEARLADAFCRIRRFHWRPGVLPGRGNGEPTTEPHASRPYPAPVSLLKLAWLALDYRLGYWLRVRPALARSTLVLFDRDYDDLAVDARRYRYGASPAWVRRMRPLVPRPDLVFVLDAPPERIRERKQEVAPAELERQREAYRRLARRRPNAVLVDASAPLEAVADRCADHVVEHLRSRYLSRRSEWIRTY